MKKAIVLLSGGIDSTIILALALSRNLECHTISFDYGQRHAVELEAAKEIANYYKVSNKLIKIYPSVFEQSSLVSPLQVPEKRTFDEMKNQGIPNTYVPARNTIFLAYALGQCELIQGNEIHFGGNKMDYDCYPDCRPAFLQAFQSLMNVATKQAIEGDAPQLISPLLYWDKTEIIKNGISLKAPLHLTMSCYNPLGLRQPCEKCDACLLREEGFRKYRLESGVV